MPIVENPPLARSLFKSVEPGQAIPLELYAAVAGILAYLYRKEVEEKMRRRQQEERAAGSRVAETLRQRSTAEFASRGVTGDRSQ